MGDTGAKANSDGAGTVALPKLQPRTKFKLPGGLASFYKPAVQLSDAGDVVAVACCVSETKSVTQVWTVSGEPKQLGEFEGGTFALSPSGKRLVVLRNGAANVYEVVTQKIVASVPRRFSFSHIFFRDDNTLVCTGRSYDFARASSGKIAVWDVTKGAELESFEIPDNRFSEALPANDRKEFWLFMASDKFEVACYDVARKALLRTVKPENNTQKPFTDAGIWNSIASDPSVFAATEVTSTNIYDATTGKVVGVLPEHLRASDTGLLPKGTRYLAHPSSNSAGLNENDFVVFDWKAKKELVALAGHPVGYKRRPFAAGSQDGRVLVSVTEDGEGAVFDISSVK